MFCGSADWRQCQWDQRRRIQVNRREEERPSKTVGEANSVCSIVLPQRREIKTLKTEDHEIYRQTGANRLFFLAKGDMAWRNIRCSPYVRYAFNLHGSPSAQCMVSGTLWEVWWLSPLLCKSPALSTITYIYICWFGTAPHQGHSCPSEKERIGLRWGWLPTLVAEQVQDLSPAQLGSWGSEVRWSQFGPRHVGSRSIDALLLWRRRWLERVQALEAMGQ